MPTMSTAGDWTSAVIDDEGEEGELCLKDCGLNAWMRMLHM